MLPLLLTAPVLLAPAPPPEAIVASPTPVATPEAVASPAQPGPLDTPTVRITPVVLPAVPRALVTPATRALVTPAPRPSPLAQAVRPAPRVLLAQEVLPYGGATLWLPFVSGICLIGVGIVLRRIARSP